MARYRGLTWDHPRGRLALERAAATATDAAGERLIDWDAQPLEGFESSPIDELAARYDVIVLDHPHLGDAIATGAVRPLDSVFPADFLAEVGRGAVGPSAASYTLESRLWALPLDAATQVAVSVPERVPTAPRTWAEVADLAAVAPVALSLAGPHAFLTYASLCVALGSEPAELPGAGFVDPEVGERALGMLAGIVRTLPSGTAELNPIGLLERMRRDRDIAYIPLVYGYVTYATGPDPLLHPELAFEQRRQQCGSQCASALRALLQDANVHEAAPHALHGACFHVAALPRADVRTAFEPQAVFKAERGRRYSGGEQSAVFLGERHAAQLVTEEKNGHELIVAGQEGHEQLRPRVRQPLALRLWQAAERRCR